MTETCGAMQREKFTNSVAASLSLSLSIGNSALEPSDNDTDFDDKKKTSVINSLLKVPYTLYKLQEFQRHAKHKVCCFVIVLLRCTLTIKVKNDESLQRFAISRN
ncbi:hypothetical protein K0M31_012941 [Melipona bicolor]|uniref:Uncharacterized protein n=1 Tax=Melipona bicolor TaxID=60889 RepID=A0AA40FIT5_9HYME|nr:hypothetical protein K0M31_012941 [Melipona bicolor]